MPFKASAPGSMMLLGEHAVLHGKPALVCAIDKRIYVTLTPRDDDKVFIQSDLLGCHETTMAELTIQKPFQFVTGVLKHFQGKVRQGCHLEITTDFSDQIGLGSSAAVTVASLAAMITWQNIRIQPIDLLRQARNIVRLVQGVGSGADIAASVYGGMVGYQPQPLSAEKFSVTHPLTALYAGFKTPTVDVIKKVQTQFASHPDVFRQLINSIGQCALSGIQAVRKENWQVLGEMMNIQQGLMESLGVSSPQMQQMTNYLRNLPTFHGAKISGAGLGDCVIGLGSLNDAQSLPQAQHIPVQISLQGVQCEKI